MVAQRLIQGIFGVLGVATLVSAACVGVRDSTARASSPSLAAERTRCALERRYPSSWNLGPRATNFTPCAPFTVASADVLAILSKRAFGGSRPDSVVALANGSAIVIANNGLYRVDHGNQVTNLWGPESEHQTDCYWLNLLAPYTQGVLLLRSGPQRLTDWLMGVRPDGSVAFHLAGTFAMTAPNDPASAKAFQDAAGVIWIEGYGAEQHALYALNLHDPRNPLPQGVPLRLRGLFGDSMGNAYAHGADGLYRLRSSPDIDASFVHADIPSPSRHPGQYGSMDSYGDHESPSAVGPDGSLWATTVTQVIHVHADGTVRVLRLHEPLTSMKAYPSYIALQMAPDGSVWTQGYHEFIRITNDDRIEAIDAPWRPDENDYTVIYSFAPDGSVWYVQSLKPNETSVVHIRIRG